MSAPTDKAKDRQKPTFSTGGENDILPDEWMIRPCELYNDEDLECRSFSGRFNQYFVHGKYLDCTQWKKDYNHCLNFRKNRSVEDAEALIESEKARRAQRIQKAQDNNIWKYRDEPPQDFNSPLPDYLQKMKLPTMNNSKQSSCVIL